MESPVEPEKVGRKRLGGEGKEELERLEIAEAFVPRKPIIIFGGVDNKTRRTKNLGKGGVRFPCKRSQQKWR